VELLSLQERIKETFMNKAFWQNLIANEQETMQPAHVSLWLRSPGRHTEEPHRKEKPDTVEEGF
jgi:hypothetical protein